MTRTEKIERIMFMTRDPETQLLLTNVPALTSLLYSVCDNDPMKFAEACRLVRLFIEETLNQEGQPS